MPRRSRFQWTPLTSAIFWALMLHPRVRQEEKGGTCYRPHELTLRFAVEGRPCARRNKRPAYREPLHSVIQKNWPRITLEQATALRRPILGARWRAILSLQPKLMYSW